MRLTPVGAAPNGAFTPLDGVVWSIADEQPGLRRTADVGGVEEVAGGECAFTSAREGLSGPRAVVVAV